MKAYVYEKYGGPEVLRLCEIDKPLPKENEVLIKVAASSINSWDWDLLTGTPRIYRLMFGLFKPKMKIIGCDVSGIVEAVGCHVTKFKPGDEVFGDLSGGNWACFAEYVCARQHEIVHKPENASFVEAAAIPQAATLALQGLRLGQMHEGMNILLNGAGGGVGTFALQIAKMHDTKISVVDHADKLEMLQKLGADYLVDYSKINYTQEKKSYDLILDVTANQSVWQYKNALKPNSTFVLIGGKVGIILQTLFVGSLISLFSNKKLKILAHRPNSSDLLSLKTLFELGKIKPIIDKTFALKDLPEAFRYYGTGKVKGKIVIVMNP